MWRCKLRLAKNISNSALIPDGVNLTHELEMRRIFRILSVIYVTALRQDVH